jgi:hypothetical protein
MYLKVMFKCKTAEKNDLESIYTKSSIFVANSLTHYNFWIAIFYPNQK